VGQVLDATDVDNITIAAKYEYDPYGNLIASSGTYAEANPFRFSTKWFDDETGLCYYGYRYYSPRLGRWMSSDPAEEHGNLYLFTSNCPLCLTDLLGLLDYAADQLRQWMIQTHGDKVQFVLESFDRRGLEFKVEDLYFGTKKGAYVDCGADSQSQAVEWGMDALREWAGVSLEENTERAFPRIAQGWAQTFQDPTVSLGQTWDFLFLFSRATSSNPSSDMYKYSSLLAKDLFNIYCFVYTNSFNATDPYYRGLYAKEPVPIPSRNGLNRRYWDATDVSGRGDQTHHFAAYLEFGAHMGNDTVDLQLALWKTGDYDWWNSRVLNYGDFVLGILGADLGVTFWNQPGYHGQQIMQELRSGVNPTGQRINTVMGR